MNNVQVSQVVNGLSDFQHGFEGLDTPESPLFLDFQSKVPALAQLRDDVAVIDGDVHILAFQNIRMV